MTRLKNGIYVTGDIPTVEDVIEAPSTPGIPGQVLSIGPDGKPRWETPQTDVTKDGYYQQMSVGLADNLAGRDSVGAVFTRRTTGGTASVGSGRAVIERIKGNTIVWNQLAAPNVPVGESYGITWTSDSNGTYIANGTATGISYVSIVLHLVVGHVYFMRGCPTNGSDTTYRLRVISGNKSDIGDGIVWMNQYDAPVQCQVLIGTTVENLKFRPQVIDFTQMFGAGNEPTTVEEFEAMFPLPYYPYNAGQLLSFNGTGIVTDGFNQWDKSQMENGNIDDQTGGVQQTANSKHTGYIAIFPDTAYYIKSDAPSGRCGAWYDADKNFISGINGIGLKTSPANAAFMRMTVSMQGNGNPDTFCINLSWSGNRNGEYEEHWQETKQLPSLSNFSKTYTGADGQTHTRLGMDGIGGVFDELTKDKDIQRFGVVDLGSLTWTQATQESGRFQAPIPLSSKVDNYADRLRVRGVCSLYAYDTATGGWGATMTDKAFALPTTYSGVLNVKDTAYTTVADFKAAMAGVLLIYELATPVEIEVPLRNMSYKMDDYGTEEILPQGVGTDEVPLTSPFVGDIKYPVKVQEKTEVASSIPSGGMLPDVFYALGAISTDPNITVKAASDRGIDHEWMLSFETGSTVPSTITFPANVIFPDTPTWEANKHYEISMKWGNTDGKYYAVVQSWDRS